MICIINRDIPLEMKNKLTIYFDRIIKTANLPKLKHPLSLHPDIQFHKLNEKTAVCEPSLFQYYRNLLPDYIVLKKGSTELSDTYPGDCAYNISQIGKNILANTRYADKKILNYYKANGYNIIHVNQGYAACNSLKLGSILITEDSGIHNTIMVNKTAFRCKKFSVGEVVLDKFPYGFIGGSAGICKNRIFWYGTPKKCSFFSELQDLLIKENIESIELSSDCLHDYGSMICFSE